MNIQIINPQFIGSQQTDRKRRLHRIDLRREHCIEDQRERERAIQLITMDPQVCGELLTHHRKGSKVDVEALRDRFPSGRVPKKASRWDRRRTEACSGGKVFSSVSLVYWEYLRIYSTGIRSGGATGGPQAWGACLPPWSHPPGLSLPCDSSGLLPKLLGPLLVQKKLIQSFFFVWTPFDNDFLKRQKKAKKTATGTGH